MSTNPRPKSNYLDLGPVDNLETLKDRLPTLMSMADYMFQTLFEDLKGLSTDLGTHVAHAILVGAGTSPIVSLPVATNGQLPIGSTGADPVIATLTAGTGQTIVNAAGSITLSPTPHALLDGVIDNDTLAAAPVLGDILIGNATPAWARLPGQITSTQKFLTQTGNGTISAVPSWQTVPSVGSLVFFFFNTASDIATYLVMKTPASLGVNQTITTAGIANGNTTLASYATPAGVPNVTFVPAGVFTCYMTARQTAGGAKVTQLFAELYQRTSGGVETLLSTSALTIPLTGVDAAYIFQGTIPTSLVFLASDRLVCKVRVAASGGGSAATVVITFEGLTAARSESPSATVDATNFVPYTGATANIDLGSKNLTTSGTLADSSLTTGSALFTGVSGVIGQDNAKFFWDDTNFRLGIGTAVPIADLDVGGGGTGHIWVRAGTGGGLAASAGAGLKIEYDSVTDKGFLQAYNYATAATKFLIFQAAGGFIGMGGIVTPTVPLDLTGDFRTTTKVRTPAIITDSGALTVTPAAGSGMSVVLSTTGDFSVNTNQVYADTSTGFTGLGVTEPLAVLQVEGSTTGAVQEFIHNANGATGSSAELNFGVWSGAIPTGTGNPGPSARIAAVNNNVGNAFANLVLSVYGVGGVAALSEVLRLQNTGLVCFSGATASFPAIKRVSTTAAFRLADDSGDAPISASTGTFSGAVTSSSPTGGVGYATGAGGTITQLTSRTTGVTLNKTTGQITMFSAAGSATAASFTVTDSSVAATDTIILNQASGTNLYQFFVTAVAAGSFVITFFTTGGVAVDAPVINFTVLKGVAA